MNVPTDAGFHDPSIYGANLSGLVLFQKMTGTDVRTPGASEQAALANGIPQEQDWPQMFQHGFCSKDFCDRGSRVGQSDQRCGGLARCEPRFCRPEQATAKARYRDSEPAAQNDEISWRSVPTMNLL